MNTVAQFPLCSIVDVPSHQRILLANDYAILIRDGFPVSAGHSLVIPKRHICSFFETSEVEKLAMSDLLDLAKTDFDVEHQSDCHNLGVNDGVAARQTVAYLHIHLIPRFDSVANDPRGGVRWVIPEKADYWNLQ
jgi:diadenosine tetraphosphate (Ap4A) HIT family hydrolase